MSTIAEKIATSSKMPYEIRKGFANAAEPDEVNKGQVLMWREVAARLTMDALGNTGQSEPDRHLHIMNEAQKWFSQDLEDVSLVFEYAQVPLEIMRGVIIDNFGLTKRGDGVKSKKKSRKAPRGKA